MAVLCAVLLVACSRPDGFHCTDDDQCNSGACRQGACTAPAADVDGGDAADGSVADTSGPADAAPDATAAGARNECAEGLAMKETDSTCARDVCHVLPGCCTLAWDEACVQRVETTCARSCSQVAYLSDKQGFRVRRLPAHGTPDFHVLDLVIADEPITRHRVNEIAVADYDSDGRADLAVSSPHGWYVLRNESALTTAALREVARHLVPGGDTSTEHNVGGHDIAWADWDLDGDLDLAVAYQRGGLALIRHDPGADPPFVEVSPALSTVPTQSFDWGDVDNDGDPDLVLTRGEKGVYLRNDRGGSFAEQSWEGDAYRGIRLCDLIDDEHPEVVTASFAGALHVHRNGGTPMGSPAFALDADRTMNYGEIDCADLDGDDDLDLIAASSTYQSPVRVFRNRGFRQGFENVIGWQLEGSYFVDAVDVGDMNGDRRLDLAVSYGGELVWLENTTEADGALGFRKHGPISGLAEMGLDLGPEPAE
jgi:hypothetical protein